MSEALIEKNDVEGHFEGRGYIRPLELARFCGIHESNVYRAIYSGQLQARKFRGKVWLIKREDADAWIDENSEPNVAA